jgi:hypothetical protein
MARQILNAEVAIKFAVKDQIDWLLHIDVDELFYVSKGDIKEHFEKISAQNCTTVTYLNCEAVPEALFIDDYFKEVTLFKRHPKMLSVEQIAYYKKLPIFNYGKDYFWFYGNGKSASRVTSNTQADGVHFFKCAEGSHYISFDPIILHYPICGFDHFWAKYETLGNFADQWFNKIDILSQMHLQSRDVVSTRDKEYAMEYYANKLLEFKKHKPDLFKQQIVERITFPAKLLNDSEVHQDYLASNSPD